MKLQDYPTDTLERAEQAASFLLQFHDTMSPRLAVNFGEFRDNIKDTLAERRAKREKAFGS